MGDDPHQNPLGWGEEGADDSLLLRGEDMRRKSFLPAPSKELSYVIGVMLGDAYIGKHDKRSYEIDLRVKDYDFCKAFSLAMAKILNKKVREPRRIKDGRWRVRYYSIAFYHWWRRQNLETLKQYIEYNKETVRYFLRGIFDAEGSRSSSTIDLYNTDLSLLNYVQYLLLKYFGIQSRLYFKVSGFGKLVHILQIRRRRHRYLFLKEIGFTIRRKQLGIKVRN